jgi:hypothetical protein
MSDKPKPKKVVPRILQNVKFSPPADQPGLKAFPTLYELLSPSWIDGKLVREGGRLSIKSDGPSFRVSIECPSEGVQTSFIVESLDKIMENSEKILSQGQMHWGLTWSRQKKNLQALDNAIE